jgi:hypothetical protein
MPPAMDVARWRWPGVPALAHVVDLGPWVHPPRSLRTGYFSFFKSTGTK